MPELVSY